MASPQTRNGYTMIANEILLALAQTPLNGYEIRYLFVLFWKTYGWGKKADWVSGTQFAQLTNLKRFHISRTQSKLLNRKIVTRIGNKLSFNKNYEEWLDRDAVTNLGLDVTKFGFLVTKNGNKLLPELVHTKENKETLQKKLTKGHDNLEKLREQVQAFKKDSFKPPYLKG